MVVFLVLHGPLFEILYALLQFPLIYIDLLPADDCEVRGRLRNDLRADLSKALGGAGKLGTVILEAFFNLI